MYLHRRAVGLVVERHHLHADVPKRLRVEVARVHARRVGEASAVKEKKNTKNSVKLKDEHKHANKQANKQAKSEVADLLCFLL